MVDPALGGLIMEVEMVEPDLFLRLSNDATEPNGWLTLLDRVEHRAT